MKIENLEIQVTYSVGLGNIEMPEKIKRQLEEIAEDFDGLDGLSCHNYPEADSWLKANIIERDCFRLKYEVEQIS